MGPFRNVADDPFGITVPLVPAHEVHSPWENGVVSCSKKSVCKGWRIAVELAFIVPQTDFMGMATCHEGHTAGATQRERAVSVRKVHVFACDTV